MILCCHQFAWHLHVRMDCLENALHLLRGFVQEQHVKRCQNTSTGSSWVLILAYLQDTDMNADDKQQQRCHCAGGP